jgi:hypothetical protein
MGYSCVYFSIILISVSILCLPPTSCALGTLQEGGREMREVKWEPLNTEPHAHNADIPGSLYKFMFVLYSCLCVCTNVIAFSHVFADVNV